MPALHDLLADDSSSGRHLLVLTDARGEILWRVGSAEVLRRADRLEFSEGADWSEAGIGTNAISEALVTGRPVQLFSAEHLVRTHHEWACTAAPITDPATGRLLGVQLSRWSADELAYELYGDAGTTAANRTEMLRSAPCWAMPWSRTLTSSLLAWLAVRDSGRVLRLLHEGRVAEALEAYPAPQLSRSGALAVELRRDQLDLAVGSAVRSSGDAGLLIHWLSADMGSADSEAVEALGRLVGRGDARYLAFRASLVAGGSHR